MIAGYYGSAPSVRTKTLVTALVKRNVPRDLIDRIVMVEQSNMANRITLREIFTKYGIPYRIPRNMAIPERILLPVRVAAPQRIVVPRRSPLQMAPQEMILPLQQMYDGLGQKGQCPLCPHFNTSGKLKRHFKEVHMRIAR